MASVLLALLIAFGKLVLLKSMNVLQADWLTLCLFATLTVLKKAGSMIFWILLIRAILSWVSQGRNPIEYVMHQLTEPFLAPFVASCLHWAGWISPCWSLSSRCRPSTT